ncbi:MAG: MarR family transcriptional regulator, partial [Halobacteriales archaeon]|nr:MarR family transcriptional regulator [Halobacteriales archaeon]
MTDDHDPARDCDDPRIHAYGVTLEAIARLNRLFDRRLREECGIPHTSFEALIRIERSGGHMAMGELASQIVLSSGGVTRLVDRLAAEGFVERSDCPEDRRVQWAVITDRGREKLAEAIGVHLVDLDREFAGRLSPEETEMLVRMMERLREPRRE